VWSLSTSWRSPRIRSGADLLDEVLRPGPDALELDYRITAKTFAEMRPLLRERGISISSIHNYFPLPAEFAPEEASGDLFFLSSPDREHRQTGVKLTSRTVELANALEAKCVVLHLGRVEVEVDNQRLKDAVDHAPELDAKTESYLIRARLEREQKKQRYVDAVLFAIEALIPVAERQGIILGLENRYYVEEIPNFEELGLLLRTFEGAPVAYWHDTGHAHFGERLGLASQEDYLRAYSSNLVGAHLHDAQGSQDHLAPGKGEIDFARIAELLPKDALRVLEVHPDVSLEEVQNGVEKLREWRVLG
jgi:sugar phosphate isomerase/epimerase